VLTKDELPFCPVATTVDLIGSKWKLLIMRELLTGTKRFSEIHRALDGVSQKVLTQSLRKMEEDKIIIRTVYPEVPPKVEYALSDLGNSLRPIIDAMQSWGIDYIQNTIAQTTTDQ
jgi:DNA-binding HxlR family transcriptional regulator